MKQRFLKASGRIAGLFAILLSLCLAIGAGFAAGTAVYADETDGGETTDENTAPVENEWLSQPAFTVAVGEDVTVIGSWTQGAFNDSEYVVSAEAKFGSGEAYFRIYSEIAGALTPVEFEEGIPLNGEMDKEAFTTDENGKVPAYVADRLNTLDEGAYYLLAVIPVDLYGEYTGLNDGYLTDRQIKDNGFAFSVTADATLTGVTIEKWTLGNYDNNKNVILAETNKGTENVIYAVYHDNGGVKGSPVTNLGAFSTDANGAVTDVFAKEALAGLGAGKYWLTASVSRQSGDSLTVTIPFDVKIQNYWAVVPSIIGWDEGRFDASENVLNGKASVGSVKFTILDKDDNVLFTINRDEYGRDTVINKDGAEVSMNALNQLTVGRYKLVAEAESLDNYTSLNPPPIEFKVDDDSVALGGIIAVTVTFAVIDLVAAGLCIGLLISRRRKVESQFRKMVSKELHRR